MSIFPSTDLIVEVANAAEPQKQIAALARLKARSSGTAADAQFAAILDNGPQPAARIGAKTGFALGATHFPSDRLSRVAVINRTTINTPTSIALQKFEAYFIQTSLETLLPKPGHGAYGTESAGGIWRSLMAEQLGAQIAKSGGLGLQKLLGAHWGERTVKPQSETAVVDG